MKYLESTFFQALKVMEKVQLAFIVMESHGISKIMKTIL